MTIQELIYWCDQQDKNMKLGVDMQEVMGKVRACCVMCGHCPSAMAEILRNVEGNKDNK